MSDLTIAELLDSAESLIKEGSPGFAIPDLHRALRLLATRVEEIERHPALSIPPLGRKGLEMVETIASGEGWNASLVTPIPPPCS